MQGYEEVIKDLEQGKERAACVELAALMRWTGPQGKLITPEHRDPADFEPRAQELQPDEAQVGACALQPAVRLAFKMS